MYRMNIPDTKKYTRENRHRRVWRRILSAMAAIVVFCTTYALILPAITLEAEPAPEATEAILPTQPTEQAEPAQTIPPQTQPQAEAETDTILADVPEEEENVIAPAQLQAPTQESAILADASDTQAAENQDGDQTETVSKPMELDAFITKATLQYRVDNGEWKNVDGATQIPGNAVFRLEIQFGNVPIAGLKEAGLRMTYTLPELLRDATASNSLTSGGTNVGSIVANNDQVTLTFDEKWINGLPDTQTTLNGQLYVQATANLSQIPAGGSTSITVGNATIGIQFEGDILAKHADITLTKSEPKLEQTENGDYLSYTLTVTAGRDGCTGVFVEDKITSNAAKVEQYCDFMPGESIVVSEDQKSFTWNIGNMDPGACKTLTYRVKLVDGFLGGKIVEAIITNTAQGFTKSGETAYPHGTVSSNFTAKGEATLSKVTQGYDSTTSTIQYTVWVKASEANTYTLNHVNIKDALDGSVSGGYVTNDNVRQYVSYIEDSFELYEGGNKGQNGSDNLKKLDMDAEPIFGETEGTHNTNFTYDVGPLKPGECRTLVYKIKVEPGAFMAANNNEIEVKNRVTIYDDEQCKGNRYENFNCLQKIGKKVWSRKLVGDPISSEETITIVEQPKETDTPHMDQDDVYDYDATNQLTKQDPLIQSGLSFTVPQGSYRYQIIANEAGDWDLSSAVMTDKLKDGYLQYVGYVQVSAYKIEGAGTSPAGTNLGEDDKVAASVFDDKTADKTVWVKIDGRNSFEFQPHDLGLDGSYAYVLTYYAKVIKQSTTDVIVANDFILTGTVGYGEYYYTLAGITARAEITVVSSNYFAAQKRFWYHTMPTGETEDAALYWIIQIDGAPIAKDIQIKDTIAGNNHGNLKTIGIYRSSRDLTAEMTVADLEGWEKVAQSSVCEEQNDGSLIYTILEDLQMNQSEENREHLYIIVSSVPSVLPQSGWDHKTYTNQLSTRSNDAASWTPEGEASQTIFGGNEIIKELGEIFTYVPGETETTEGKKTTIESGSLWLGQFPIQWDHLTGGGIYVSWHIRVNQGGTLNGTYRVQETIPDGMQCVYMINGSDRGNSKFVEITGLDVNWAEVKKHYDHAAKYQDATYYVNGQTVMWDVVLKNGNPANGDCYTEFQIVCKITDPDVLQGNVSKTFTNTVSMTGSDNVLIGTDSDAVTVQRQSLSKSGTYDQSVNGGVYPFQITVNDLGTDLVAGGETITLVDELSDTLILDPTSIQVVNTNTKENVAFTSSVDGQILKLVLPDDQPLTITYHATINAAPGQQINLSNKAHWEGYSAGEGTTVKRENFSYAVGGSVETSSSPKLTIVKLDQNNTALALAGAEFQIQKISEWKDCKWQEIQNGATVTQTTGDDGKLTFGTDEHLLEFNTIYRLTEIKAPDGYVLDSTAHDFAVLQADENGNYPKLEGVTAFYNVENSYTVYNHKGEAEVRKVFRNAGGEEVEKINGTYWFGIYNGEDKLVQKVSIVYKDGVANTGVAKFTNLTLGECYMVYELDDQGNPIAAGSSAAVCAMPFVVSYDNQAVTIQANIVQTVTVTNRINYAELPATGGFGTAPVYLAGMCLVVAALFLLKKRRSTVK